MLTDFLATFPEFDPDTVEAEFPTLLAIYPAFYNYIYGQSPTIDTAILWILAHLFYVRQLPGGRHVNQFLSNGVGSTNGSYNVHASPTETRSFLQATSYGQIFWKMSSKRQGGIFV